MSEPQYTAKWLPDKKLLAQKYEEYKPVFKILLERLEALLRKKIVVSSTPNFRCRLKEFPSYYRKLLRVMSDGVSPNEELPILSDLFGIRIICAFLQDLTDVEMILREEFTVIEVERKGADRTFREFGYESTHILLKVPSEVLTDLELPKDLIFEIQVRTILQDAWAEVEHELVYKSEFSPFDLPLKRKLASINASLSLADIIFQEIRDYQNKLNRELDKRRGSFYKQADIESNLDLTEKKGSRVGLGNAAPLVSSPYINGTIDDMLLDAIASHNSGDLEHASEIYTKIIEQATNDTILSVIYKHRGMAYFAQSRYEEALKDFTKSSEHDREGFRSYYYIAIVLSVLGRETEAVENFSKSLERNEFQPYVYFRRAQSYYNLEHYTDALNDLDRAVSLGYNKGEESMLRILIAKKLDIS